MKAVEFELPVINLVSQRLTIFLLISASQYELKFFHKDFKICQIKRDMFILNTVIFAKFVNF